jgi:putative ABC transport system permease protein
MLGKMLLGALRQHPLRPALVLLSAAMGSGIAGALWTVAHQAQERLATEMRSFGANVVVEPALAAAPDGDAPSAATLAEADLPRVLTIFWRNAVVGLAPTLAAPAQVSAAARSERTVLAGLWFDRSLARPGGGASLRVGVAPLFPYWHVQGAWPAAGAAGDAAAGAALAARLGLRPGDEVRVGIADREARLRVVGIVRTGGFEEDELMVNLEAAQALLGAPGKISRILVSAVTVPLDAFGRRDPATLTRRELERWSCTPYVTSVARQVQDAVPGSRARPVWSMAEAEGQVLSRLDVLVFLLAGLVVAAAALAVASSFAARVMGRRAEIALMRAQGAGAGQIALVLGAEVAAVGAAGGGLGAILAWALVHAFGVAVFGTPLAPGLALVPVVSLGALLVAGAGAIWPIRRALALDPVAELKEGA